jgi:serine/threonine protein kinase
MKMVYLAEDLRLASRSCALAEMVDSFTDPAMQQQAVAAFQREADMLARLSNEHIPRVFDRFSDQNRHYLVMEFVDGITLEDELKKVGGKLDESRVIDSAIQILDTLEYLHNLEPPVIYRDLKPSNVMLTRNGQVKLIDFGIARFFLPQSNATMIGTQGYAPPEQYRGRAEARSDLYALGATMHHALSGRDPATEPPFSFPKLRSLNPDTNPVLADLVDQALSYDVIHRMADAKEFKQRLLDIKSGVTNGAAANGPRAASGRPQMRLPLGGGTSQPQGPHEAATILLGGEETRCRSCSRIIPADSRFCSFCGVDLSRSAAPGNSPSNAESATVVLPEWSATSEPQRSRSVDSHPNWKPARRDPRARRFIVAMLVGLILVAVAVTSVINYVQRISRPVTPPDYGSSEAPIPPEPAMPPGVENPKPDASEPPHTSAEEMTLRELFNMEGLRNVHFRMKGDTIVLWGTVPSEFSREQVRGQAMMFSDQMIDHMIVRPDPYAGVP